MTISVTASDGSAGHNQPKSTQLGWWPQLSFAVAHATVRGLLIVLTLPGLYHFGRAFGTLEYIINRRRRKRFARALARVLGRPPTSSERRRETREFFIQSRCNKMFYLIFDCIPQEKAIEIFSIGNQALFDKCFERGCGIYLALSHHGPQHVIAMFLALQGYKTAGVREENESALRRYVQARFDRKHPEFQRLRIIFSGRFPREIFRCFRDGYVLGSQMDVGRVRDSSQKTEVVEMFGEQRSFLTGPLRIAYRCGTPVLQAFVFLERGFRYRLEIVGTLFDPEQNLDEDAVIARAMPAYATCVTKYVRESPSLITRI